MKETFNSIVRLLPAYKEKIEFLLMTDENFLELCTDYIFCGNKVLEMKKEMDKNRRLIEEFEGLQQQLELEILDTVNKNRNNPEKI